MHKLEREVSTGSLLVHELGRKGGKHWFITGA